MKQIVILIFTVLGICKGFAQNPVGNNMPDSLQISNRLQQKKVGDSLIIIEKATLKVYPNPAKNKVEVEVAGFEPGLIQVQLIDINGKVMRDDQRLLINKKEIITVMFSLPKGIYFILIKQKGRAIKKKMVVQ